MKITNPCILITACILSLACNTRAEQGGSGHYASGQLTDFSGLAPSKPGWIFANYLLDYNEGEFNGSKGLPFGKAVGLGVTADYTAEVPMVLYGYPFDFLGGTLSSGVTIPYVSLEVKAKATLGNRTKSIDQTTSGLGDITLMPIMASWTNGDFTVSGIFNVFAPTGEYNKEDLANVGLGYWTFDPMVAFTWLSSKIGTEFSIFTGLDFNTKNTEADYQSGDIFHVDVTLAQHLPLLGGIAGAGASAFYLKQITGDSGSGAKNGGFEAESYGVGPTISYVHPVGKSTLVMNGSWLPQLHTENTTKGDFFWFKVAVAF